MRGKEDESSVELYRKLSLQIPPNDNEVFLLAVRRMLLLCGDSRKTESLFEWLGEYLGKGGDVTIIGWEGAFERMRSAMTDVNDSQYMDVALRFAERVSEGETGSVRILYDYGTRQGKVETTFRGALMDPLGSVLFWSPNIVDDKYAKAEGDEKAKLLIYVKRVINLYRDCFDNPDSRELSYRLETIYEKYPELRD